MCKGNTLARLQRLWRGPLWLLQRATHPPAGGTHGTLPVGGLYSGVGIQTALSLTSISAAAAHPDTAAERHAAESDSETTESVAGDDADAWQTELR